jgi:hypothetical protein
VMPVNYKDMRVGTRRAAFLIEDKISAQIKVRSVLEPQHLAQTINYTDDI